jgi:hypothetical protein
VKLSVLFIQKLYGSTHHKTAAGKIKQFYDDIDEVVNDQNEAIRATGFLGANNFGNNNELILNSDIDTKNITMKEANGLILKLQKRFKKDASFRHLCLLFFASHGMAFESTQHIVLNEFSPTK